MRRAVLWCKHFNQKESNTAGECTHTHTHTHPLLARPLPLKLPITENPSVHHSAVRLINTETEALTLTTLLQGNKHTTHTPHLVINQLP